MPAMSNSPVVLVTGASRGLGRGIALECARAGYSVAIHYGSNEVAAGETRALCESVAPQASQRFVPVGGNLAVSSERASVLQQTLSDFGRLDAVVNNAGMAPRVRADLTEASEASYDEVMSVNLKGPFFLSQIAAGHWLSHPDRILVGRRLQVGVHHFHLVRHRLRQPRRVLPVQSRAGHGGATVGGAARGLWGSGV